MNIMGKSGVESGSKYGTSETHLMLLPALLLVLPPAASKLRKGFLQLPLQKCNLGQVELEPLSRAPHLALH